MQKSLIDPLRHTSVCFNVRWCNVKKKRKNLNYTESSTEAKITTGKKKGEF